MCTMQITKTSGSSSFIINSNGARLEELRLQDKLLITPQIRGDGKPAVTHPCSPIFGPETETTFGLMQHGRLRTSECEVVSEDAQSVTVKHEINEGTYPKGVIFRQTFTLSDSVFSIETSHENTGSKPAPVNFCEHFYWYAPSGWEGLTVNGEDGTTIVKADDVIVLDAINRIEIPNQPVFLLEQEGLPLANLWAMRSGAGANYDSSYVCIEPCHGRNRSPFFGSQDSLIAPKSSNKTTIRVSLI